MAYKNSKYGGSSKSDYKMKGMKGKYYSHKQGDMMPHVDDFSKPAACYSQMYDQAPLNYIARNNSLQGHEAGMMRKEAHKGRYDK